jgi:hypothetical protein
MMSFGGSIPRHNTVFFGEKKMFVSKLSLTESRVERFEKTYGIWVEARNDEHCNLVIKFDYGDCAVFVRRIGDTWVASYRDVMDVVWGHSLTSAKSALIEARNAYAKTGLPKNPFEYALKDYSRKENEILDFIFKVKVSIRIE